ncbi:Aste57867_2125 [Aphanomyces stellatus]|uniref:Aste57867_2125 protein n=1 Tax=Aphanomyces stellatus TaxID=120398 RepID=A0A485K6R6_9STRA|nr:hypothetical protein As57867_002120 [Aphanomyces stellatus]VFT79328.1 Aste57867_2125 [Aphanomyces stellatus]
MTKTCYINGCTHPVIANSWRCRHHRHRGRCIVDNCDNQVYARNLCCRHGAKKTCEHDGCTLRARLGNVCYKHGAHKKQCTEPGCTQPAQARQKCVKHGGGRKCKADACTAHARTGGYCQRHRTADSDVSSPKSDRSTSTATTMPPPRMMHHPHTHHHHNFPTQFLPHFAHAPLHHNHHPLHHLLQQPDINMTALWGDKDMFDVEARRHGSMDSVDDISELEPQIKLEPGLVNVHGIDIHAYNTRTPVTWGVHPMTEDKTMLRDILDILEEL